MVTGSFRSGIVEKALWGHAMLEFLNFKLSPYNGY
jgi:hypothetical protein